MDADRCSRSSTVNIVERPSGVQETPTDLFNIEIVSRVASAVIYFVFVP
jgi:hypothetical protein